MHSEWWRGDGWPTPEEWNALFVGLTFAVAFVAAIVALIQYRSHLRAERDRTRPYVIVDYAFRSILMQVEIKNIGTSAAADVHLSVDPPFESGIRDQAERLNEVFSADETISMLAPGRRILYTFDRAPDYFDAKRPEKYAITAEYQDLPTRWSRPWRRGWRKTAVVYVDRFPLDFRQWSRASAETDYEEKNWNIANRGEQRDKKIIRALETIAEAAKRRPQPLEEEYVLDTVQEGDLTKDYAIHHPVFPEAESVPPETAEKKRRGGPRWGGPRTRWVSR